VVPLEQLGGRRQRPDHRVGRARLGDLDLVPADLRLGHPVRLRARDLGEQLRAKADAEGRNPALERPADELLLGTQPWMAVVLIDVHGPPEDHQGFEIAVRGRAGGRNPGGQVLRRVAEHAGAGVQLVDYREDPHSGVTYAPDRPPSTRKVCAVTYEDSSLARNSTPD